jgi:hypothetical protein
MSDEIYEPGADLEDDGVLEPSDTLDDDDLSSDVLDTGIAAPDHYAGANRFGTTLSEQRQGESLDQRLSEEEPDIGPDEAWTDEDRESDDGDERSPRTGRLVAPDEGAHPDDETDEVAFDAGIDGGGASAEEAAMHIVRE